MKEFLRRFRHLARGSRFDSELSDEIRFHVDSRAAELEREGLPREEALLLARREFGRSAVAQEETRAAWSIAWLADLASDLRYAARAIRRSPAFAVTAIFCLALGIGANATLFNIITSVMFKQPSCRDVASLILVREGANSAPMADYRFLRDAHIFDGVTGIDPGAEMNWRDGERGRRFSAARVTDNFFGVLGMPLRLGRGIAPGETNTVVIAERVWRQRFSMDAGILGRRLVLDGGVYTVVGVMPENDCSIVGLGYSPDVYVPITQQDESVQLYARMPRGMTRAVARARLVSVLDELDRIRPEGDRKRTRNAGVFGVRESDSEDAEDAAPALVLFTMLMTLAGLVLLIACTNVASLLLARASARRQELAVRLSLGASRARIVRHLLAESLVLAVLGCSAGLLIDIGATRLLRHITFPGPLPVELVIEPDLRLLIYSIALALGSAMVAGLLPAIQSARRDVSIVLKAESRQTGRTWNLRSILVAGQLAVSVVLVAAAFLFLHNLRRASTMNPGFDVDHTLWAWMRIVPDRYRDPQQRAALVNTALDQLRALPGVKAAAIAERVPLNDECWTNADVTTDLDSRPRKVRFACNSVGPDYFTTMGIQLLDGREFSGADHPGAARVAIVNESFAGKLFGTTNPVGHTVRWGNEPPRLIVGLVKDSRYSAFREKQQPALYQPLSPETAFAGLNFLVRTAGPAAPYTNPVTDLLGRLDSTAAIETKPMSNALGLALFGTRMTATLLGTMGALGLALASIGLYGVLLYSVSRRTREIGLRVALGASPAQVLGMVCRHSAALVGIGTALGLLVAMAALRPMAMFLVEGVEPADPTALAGVVAVLGVVALAATVAPAVRALRIDPNTALRYE